MSENKKRIHVQHYYSPESNRVPSVESASNPDGIVQGEIAINVPDEKLFIAKNDKSGVATFSSDEKLDEKYVHKETHSFTEDESRSYYTNISTIDEYGTSFFNVNVEENTTEETYNGTINVESGNVDAVMDGSIDTFINGYLKWINLKPETEN